MMIQSEVLCSRANIGFIEDSQKSDMFCLLGKIQLSVANYSLLPFKIWSVKCQHIIRGHETTPLKYI